MADSNTEIANLALGHLGVGVEIADLDTENSQAARACRRFYETARKKTLRDFPWPFAKKTADLVLYESTPNDEWDYSYIYPSDCLMIRRIRSGSRVETRQSRIPYVRAKHPDTDAQVIHTDEPSAALDYTVDFQTESYFSDDFVLALSWLLAHYVVPSLTRGDPFNLRQSTMQEYMMQINQAHANAANEEQADEEPASEFERAREGAVQDWQNRRRII